VIEEPNVAAQQIMLNRRFVEMAFQPETRL